MERKKSIQEIIYVLLLIAAIMATFCWYTSQNSKRMEERNKNYASDSARSMALKIDDDLNNALSLINTYSYFAEESLSEPVITAETLKKMEENSLFDALIYTDADGIDYASDGREAVCCRH